MTLAAMAPTEFIVGCAIMGLLVGSFLNVVIHRLPRMMEQEWNANCAEVRGEPAPDDDRITLSRPRSRCPHCGHQITAIENVPIVSYLMLKGRCSHCKARISLRYPATEVLTALLSGFAAYHFGPGWTAIASLVFIWTLLALTFIDLDTQLLPDALTLPLLWAGLLVNLGATHVDLRSAVIGAVAGYLTLWSVYWLFKLATGKEGMGFGDFKLLAAIGAWLGWQQLPLTILLSSVVGAIIGLALIVIAKRGREIPMPFGPYLAIAGMIALFWGKELTQTYLGLLG
ncbi:MAG TPA: A24 family peptidase [Rhodocyclaceae bacterium]|nr:prepilin peptidase [Rhodocyclaceae bacterium]HMV53897.1 A24 family peptidase [Rhodocyclaceae bacterium]HNA02978.1 A24 family peptidase [Rhodocyclaceae bacterium]HNB78078.1 A24 family peptidase [Rhodocyclaceae bacterium]HNC60529.1 A24 family peptidase [Rhodocyclaceae bacterium]